jgi:hypothetical protein
MRAYNKQVKTATLLVVALAIIPVMAQAATHYWPLYKEARAGNTQAARQVIQAARAGHRPEQYYAGLLYYHGWGGVSQNYAKAVYWFRKAAKQGSVGAEDNMGLLYARGQGVPQSFTKANFWWRKAAAQGSAEARYNLAVDYAHGWGVPQRHTADEALAPANN